MSAYLSYLPPAPWHFRFDRESGTFYVCGADGFPILLAEKDDEAGGAALESAALARNALDVMQRRKWGVRYCPFDKVWWLETPLASRRTPHPHATFAAWIAEHASADPFDILIEADTWFAENVEKIP